MKKIMKSNKFIYALIVIIGIYYLIWAYLLKYNSNPDEQMRYLIPQYIFHHGSLPSGYSKGAMLNYGNWSYAFYPQLLGGIVSAFFMKLMSIFNSSFTFLVFAARWTSVICGIISIIFVSKSVVAITRSRYLGVVAILFTAFLPQFTYLSSYVNNDIIAVAGISIIIYSLINASLKIFNYYNGLLLATGIIFCMLGYINSSPFVLIGVLYAIILLIYQIKKGLISLNKGIKVLIYSSFIAIIFIAPFYIRNWLLYHDFLGMNTFHKQYMKWIYMGGKKLQHPFEAGYFNLLFNSGWIIGTFKSFIGVFGYLSIFLKNGWYIAYLLLMYSGIVGYLGYCKQQKNKFLNLLSFSMFIASLMVIFLSIYYSVNTDFQSQGRYIMGIFPFLSVACVIGLGKFFSFIFCKPKVLINSVMLIYIFSNILFAFKYIFPVIG